MAGLADDVRSWGQKRKSLLIGPRSVDDPKRSWRRYPAGRIQGLFIVGLVGFSHINVVHNAANDSDTISHHWLAPHEHVSLRSYSRRSLGALSWARSSARYRWSWRL